MRMRGVGSALRKHSLTTLMKEAAWRAIRSIRKRRFRRTEARSLGTVIFQPIGYYRLQEQPASARAQAAIVCCADSILRGEFPLLGYGSPRLGMPPDWHCDWVSGKSWSLEDSNRVSIVRHDGSDVKAPWELSRLQWCPVVAKAYVLTGESRYRLALQAFVTDWIKQNPAGKGVHWTIAMEVALRGVSLCLTMELLWPFSDEEQPWLEEMTSSLWLHLRFIEANNEFSFLLRSNHYLSNLVGLTTLAAYLQGTGMKRRLVKYARAVNREILLQTYRDGGDHEASTGYHVLVAQMFLHSFVVQQQSIGAVSPEFQARLRLMFEWIAKLADDSWTLPLLGDCDNGRIEWGDDLIQQLSSPPAEQHSLQVEDLCRRAFQLLQRSSGAEIEERTPASLLSESGIAVLRTGEASVLFCAMPNGLLGQGSHTHCDKLSFVLSLGGREVFCDSGSRCYTRSAGQRNLDRSTRAHNTLVADKAEQNFLNPDPRSLFQSGNEATVSPITISANTARASHDGYRRLGVEHQRTLELNDRALLLLDRVGGSGNHLLQLRFILGPEWHVSPEQTAGELVCCVIEGPRRLTLECRAQSSLALCVLPTEISRAYGVTLPASSIEICTTTVLPAELRTRVEWD